MPDTPDQTSKDLPLAAQRALAEAKARRAAEKELILPKELGGRVGPEWIKVLTEAANRGLDVVSGLHMRLEEYPSRDQWSTLLQRPTHDQSMIEKIVRPILDKVQRGGDRALKKFALEYDHVTLEDLRVKGIVHKNTASRKMSRLAGRVKALAA